MAIGIQISKIIYKQSKIYNSSDFQTVLSCVLRGMLTKSLITPLIMGDGDSSHTE